MRAFVPPARLGIHYEPAGIRRAMERLGAQTARRMFLLGETYQAEALLAAGFLDRLVPAERLDAEAAEMAEALAGLAPLAVRGMKRTILELSRGALDEGAARARVAACFASADHAEGLARSASGAARGSRGGDGAARLSAGAVRRGGAAALPDASIRAHLPEPPRGRTVVVGAGKGAAQLAQALEAAWEGPLEGVGGDALRLRRGVPADRGAGGGASGAGRGGAGGDAAALRGRGGARAGRSGDRAGLRRGLGAAALPAGGADAGGRDRGETGRCSPLARRSRR
jgi:hypothetical protein